MVEVAVVEVALKERTVRTPAITASPLTPRVVPGVVEPIPRREFPVSVTRKFAESRVDAPE